MAPPLVTVKARSSDLDPYTWVQGQRKDGVWTDLYCYQNRTRHAPSYLARVVMERIFDLSLPELAPYEDFRLRFDILEDDDDGRSSNSGGPDEEPGGAEPQGSRPNPKGSKRSPVPGRSSRPKKRGGPR